MAEKRVYEGMFLLDAGQDIEAAGEPIRKVLGRGEAEVLTLKPWDERRLTYDIEDRKRGLYVLTYFKMDPANVAEVEREIQLDEHILRALLLRRDGLSDEVINAETPATLALQRGVPEVGTGEGEAGDQPAAAEAPAEAPAEEAAPAPEAAAAEEPAAVEASPAVEDEEVKDETAS